MKLPNIDISDSLYQWVLQAKKQRGFDSLAQLVREALTEFCAPHLKDGTQKESTVWDQWPIVDNHITCPQCARGRHCGGGPMMWDGEEFIVPDSKLRIRERQNCNCPQCLAGSVSVVAREDIAALPMAEMVDAVLWWPEAQFNLKCLKNPYPKINRSMTNYDEMMDDYSKRLREWKIYMGIPLDAEREALDARKREILRKAPVQP